MNDESRRTFTPDEPIIIHTYHPEDEVWHYVSKLTSLTYVVDLLKERIEKRFFGLDTTKIMDKKDEYNRSISPDLLDNNDYIVETYETICNDSSVNHNAKEIVHTIRQAIELYKAAQTVSLYAKPVLLYYSYTRLARVLFLATYRPNKTQRGAHGLTIDENDILCQKNGAFSRFQDSLSSDPSIYLERHVFKWHDLLLCINIKVWQNENEDELSFILFL